MVQRHSEAEVFDFITGDFRSAWNALAEIPETIAGHRGNFMFALQAMILLEWVCRLSSDDANALQDFSKALKQIEPGYFTQLDTGIPSPREFSPPGIGPDPLKNLLSVLWDLIRNGNVHEYQDIFVTLTDGRHWALGLLGVKYKCSLAALSKERSSLRHLTYCLNHAGDLTLTVHPGALFLDIFGAVRNANLLSRGLVLKPLVRPRDGKGYQLDSGQLERSLQKGGLSKL